MKPTSRGQDSLTDRIASERRPDGALLERRQRCRQRAAAQNEREVGRRLRREVAAFDEAGLVDLAVDDRSGDDLVVENDGQAAFDVRARQVAELARSVRGEREADGRLAELPLLHAGVFQVGAGDRNRLADGVILDARRAAERVFTRAGQDVDLGLHVRRDAVERRRRIRGRLAFDQAELKLRRRLDDVLHARRIVDPGQLDDDAVVALRRDVRLGHAEGVDAIVDRLHRMRDRVALDGRQRGGLHLELHRPFGRAAHVERRDVVLGDRLVPAGRRIGGKDGDEGRVVHALRRRDRKVALFRLCLEHFRRLIGLQAYGIADVHAHDQMRTALQVEAAADRLGVVFARYDRPGKAHQDDQDQDDFPQQTSSQVSSRKKGSGYSAASPVMIPVTAERVTLTFTFSAIFR